MSEVEPGDNDADPCPDPGNPVCEEVPICDDEPGVLCTWLGQYRPGSSQSDPVAQEDATLRFPMDLTFGPTGAGYIADWLNHSIRAIEDDEPSLEPLYPLRHPRTIPRTPLPSRRTCDFGPARHETRWTRTIPCNASGGAPAESTPGRGNRGRC